MSAIDAAERIAIVGAGPVGKSAALLLAAYGTPVVLIERRTTPSDEPKAISIDDEALRAYQTAGVIERILPIIVPGLGTKYFGRDSAPLFLAGAGQSGRFGYPYKNPFAQPDLERVLHEAVEAHPLVRTIFGSEVVSLSQNGVGVELGLRMPAGTESTQRAAYVVGADGGRSVVRSLTGIRMHGRSRPENWIVIDTRGDPHTERYGLHYGTPDRPHVIVPGLGDRCRYEFRLFEGEGEPGEPPSHELIAEILSPYRSIARTEIERAVVYTFNSLNAETYQSGRAFLAGDAAHMMPPFAGQGLNSGIRDAMNLCWKLAGVFHGELAERVLESYSAERRPHAGAMVRLSDRLGTIVMTSSERVASHRDRLVRDALEDSEKRAWFEGMKYRPLGRYTAGLVAGDHPITGTQLNQPKVFDAVAGTIGLLDESLGHGWAIVGVDVTPEQWIPVTALAERLGLRRVHAQLDDTMPHGLDVDVLAIDVDGTLEAALTQVSGGGGFVLVRPDRFVAAAWEATTDVPIFHAELASWFGVDDAEHHMGDIAHITRSRGAGSA